MYTHLDGWEHANLVAQWNSKNETITQLKEGLESVNYGHNFSYDYVCANCKMCEMIYMVQRPDRWKTQYPREDICSAIQTVDDLKKLEKLIIDKTHLNCQIKKETN